MMMFVYSETGSHPQDLSEWRTHRVDLDPSSFQPPYLLACRMSPRDRIQTESPAWRSAEQPRTLFEF